MNIRRLVALAMSIVLMLSASVGYAGEKYQYLFDNAAGKVYLVTTDDGWKFMYFEGQNRMVCQGYEGSSSQVKLPAAVDGHPVMIGSMNLPSNQITRFEIPEDYSEVSGDTFGDISNLKHGCTIVVYNRNAILDMPIDICQRMGYTLSGYLGSTTQTYAESFGIRFVAIGASASEKNSTAAGAGSSSAASEVYTIVVKYEDDFGEVVEYTSTSAATETIELVSFRDTIKIDVTAKGKTVFKGLNNMLDVGDLYWDVSGDIAAPGIGSEFNLKLNSWNTLRGNYSSTATIKLCRVVKKYPFGKSETLAEVEFNVNRDFHGRFMLYADNIQRDGNTTTATMRIPLQSAEETVQFYVADYAEKKFRNIANVDELKLYIDGKEVSAMPWSSSPHDGLMSDAVTLAKGKYRVTLKFRDILMDEITLTVVDQLDGAIPNFGDNYDGTVFTISQSCVWISNDYSYVRDFSDPAWKKMGFASGINKGTTTASIAPSHILLLTSSDAIVFADTIAAMSQAKVTEVAQDYLNEKTLGLFAQGAALKWTTEKMAGNLYTDIAEACIESAFSEGDKKEAKDIVTDAGVNYATGLLMDKLPVVNLALEWNDLCEVLFTALHNPSVQEMAKDIKEHAEQGYGVTIMWGYDTQNQTHTCKVYYEDWLSGQFKAWKTKFRTPVSETGVKLETGEQLKGYIVTDQEIVDSVYRETLNFLFE